MHRLRLLRLRLTRRRPRLRLLRRFLLLDTPARAALLAPVLLRRTKEMRDVDGTEHIRYNRTFDGLPVVGGDQDAVAVQGVAEPAQCHGEAPLISAVAPPRGRGPEELVLLAAPRCPGRLQGRAGHRVGCHGDPRRRRARWPQA